jgi:hypothetical protein
MHFEAPTLFFAAVLAAVAIGWTLMTWQRSDVVSTLPASHSISLLETQKAARFSPNGSASLSRYAPFALQLASTSVVGREAKGLERFDLRQGRAPQF